MSAFKAFFGGRVEVEAKGNQIESFINRLHRSKIPLYAPKRTEDGILRFSMPARSFKRLRTPAFKTGTRIRILKKRGFFMVIRPFRRRLGLALGAALFFGLIFWSSGFIWQVEVKGCEETSSTQVLADLEELGLKIGCRRTIDVDPIENQYLTANDKLSWMSINIRGTTAYVEVKEKGVPVKVEDPSVPTNIYAARDGIILAVRDYGGTRCVQVGDPVKAGDLLVSGDWTDKYGVRRLSHCIATVIAQTQRETTVTVPLSETVRQKTGKNQKKYAISFGKFKIPLYFNKKIAYNEYDTMEKVYPLRIASFAFPVQVHTFCAEEVTLSAIQRSAEQARAIAENQLGFYRADQLAEAVVQKCEVEESLSKEALTLRATFYCEEEIGIEMPIEE